MKQKTLKDSCSKFFILLFASILCFQMVQAGIYRVVVLRSPDGLQRVRLYFDHHYLGLQQDNVKQLEIIQKAVETFKAQKNSFTILVESPNYYQAPAAEFPQEQEWTLLQETQPITSEAIAVGLSEGQPKRPTDYSSSLFSPIPRMGSMLKASDINVHIISVEVRNLLINFEQFVNGNHANCSMLQESLEAVYKKTLEQVTASKIMIPAKESLVSGQQTGHIHTVRAFSSEYQAKINKLFQKWYTAFEAQMFDLRRLVGDAVWHCNIFTGMEEITPGIDRAQKCTNYIQAHDRYWDVPCFEGKENEIGRLLDKAISGPLSLYYLEYDVLKYILDPVAPREIAVFVGGSHGEKIESALKEVGYTVIYENGYSMSEILSFNLIQNPYYPDASKKGLLEYSPESSQLINSALQETLVVGSIPSFDQIEGRQDQKRRFLEQVYELMRDYDTVLQRYGQSLPQTDAEQKMVLTELVQMKQKINELSQKLEVMGVFSTRVHGKESMARAFDKAIIAVRETGFLRDALEQIIEFEVEASKPHVSKQKGKKMGGNSEEYEDESPRKKVRIDKLDQTVGQSEAPVPEASFSEQKGKIIGSQDEECEERNLLNKVRMDQAAILIQAGARGGLARIEQEKCPSQRSEGAENEDNGAPKKREF